MESEKHLCLFSAHACSGRGGSRGASLCPACLEAGSSASVFWGARLFWGFLFFPCPTNSPVFSCWPWDQRCHRGRDAERGTQRCPCPRAGSGAESLRAAPTSCPIAGFGWARAGGHGATPLVQDQTSVFETRLTSFGYFYLLPHSPGLV